MARARKIVRQSRICLRYPMPYYRIVRDGKWESITEQSLKELESSDKTEYLKADGFIYDFQQAPIRNFMAHGVKGWGNKPNEGLQCLNDWDNDLVLLLAPNQVGKTTLGAAYCILHGLVPCNPEWEVFTKHGVLYKEWAGPKILIAASYSWDNVRTLWEAYRSLLPRKEITTLSPMWGQFDGEDGAPENLTLGKGSASSILDLACGSKIIFLCYTQREEHWEGKQCDFSHLDEQCPEDKFDGLTVRQLTRGNYTPIIMTLTGHILPDRPDTGAGGWIKTKLIDQAQCRGRKFKTYHLSVETTPDVIMDPKQKKRSRVQWVDEPARNKDIKKINEGKARYWGEWQYGGGLVFNEIVPEIHVIEEFDIFPHKPMWIRMIDHGKDPCAALLFAKLPWGDCVVAKEYYVWDRSIADNARGIVEDLCENGVKVVDEYMEGDQRVKVYEENYLTRIIADSELDSRSYGTPALQSTGKTIGILYNEAGLTCRPAVTTFDRTAMPMTKELFALDKNREHINAKLRRPVPEAAVKYGSPQLYIFSTCKYLLKELGQFTEKIGSSHKHSESSKFRGMDHLVSCLKFYSARPRSYIGESFDTVAGEEDEEETCEEESFRV